MPAEDFRGNCIVEEFVLTRSAGDIVTPVGGDK